MLWDNDLKDLMKSHISDPNVALCINLETMWHVKETRAPMVQQISSISI